jgi:hypothetical protein
MITTSRRNASLDMPADEDKANRTTPESKDESGKKKKKTLGKNALVHKGTMQTSESWLPKHDLNAM